MKIAVVVNKFPKLSETFVINEIIELVKKGMDVEIIALKHTDDQIHSNDVEEYNLMNRVLFLDWQSSPKKIINYLLFCIKIFICIIFRFRTFLKILQHSKNIKYTLKLWSRLGIRRRNYDFIYVHFGYNAIKIMDLYKFNLINGKLAVVFHGSDLSAYIEKQGKDVYKELFMFAEKLMPISSIWYNKLIELGADEKKISLHRLGMPLNELQYRSPSKNSAVHFISVCRLVEKKGIEIAIKALSELDINSDFEYTIIGDGPLLHDLKLLTKNLKLDDKVHFLGSKKHDEAIQILKSCDVLLAPSYEASNGDKEGIPVAIMESMALGLIVVSTYHSGIPELVIDRKSGFLAIEKDVMSYREKIIESLQSDWTTVSRNAREAIENQYSIQKNMNDVYELFSENE